MTQNTDIRIISSTLERMKTNPHLPGELVTILGETARLQAESSTGLDIDLAGCPPADQAGVLCPPELLPLDPAHCAGLADRILALMTDPALGLSGFMAASASAAKDALAAGDLDLGAVLAEVRSGFVQINPPTPLLTAWAEKTPETPSFLSFLTAAAAAPSTAAGAAALAETADLGPEEIRFQGNCPVCGSLPYMLELEGKEGRRLAHCPCCRHTFRIRRLACACCNTDQGDSLKYFTADGEAGFRVEACDACGTYVKTIDFRELDREAFAPLNDLESMALDVLAHEAGYRRMAPSVWRI